MLQTKFALEGNSVYIFCTELATDVSIFIICHYFIVDIFHVQSKYKMKNLSV